MKTRLLSSLLLVLVMLVGMVPAANAQGGGDSVCFNLSADDCAILTGALANSENMDSFNMNFTADFSLAGLSSLGAMMGSGTGSDSGMPGDITFHIEGSGPYAMISSDTFPPIILDVALNAMMNSGSDSQSASMEVRIVDGYVYFTDPDTGDWSGILVQDAMTYAENEMGLSGLFGSGGDMPSGALNPQDLMNSDPAALMDAAGLGDNAAALLDVPGFINHVRLDDQDMMGQTMHVFELTLDFTPLFASTDFQTILNSAITQATEADPQAAQMAMVVPMLLSGLTGNVVETQMVGADDNFLHSTGLDLNATLDLGVLMPPSSSSSSDTPQIPPIDLGFSFNVTLDQINETFSVAAPEGATILTAEDLSSSSGM